MRAINWKYAVGELVLIVSGILIAIAANSWYQDRQLRSEEVQALQQIRHSLDEDHTTLLERAERLNRHTASAKLLYDALRSTEVWKDDWTDLINTINGIAPTEFRTAPFEALRSRSFELISDDALRIELITLYDDRYDLAKRNVESDVFFVHERVRPYLLEHFLRDPSDKWIAKDIEDVRRQGYLANLAKMRSYSLDNFVIPSMDRAIAANRKLARLVDEFLVDPV